MECLLAIGAAENHVAPGLENLFSETGQDQHAAGNFAPRFVVLKLGSRASGANLKHTPVVVKFAY